MASEQPKKTPKQPRLSLYGMTPEDALRRALSTPPPKPPDKRPARSKVKVKQRKGKAG